MVTSDSAAKDQSRLYVAPVKKRFFYDYDTVFKIAVDTVTRLASLSATGEDLFVWKTR